MQEKNLFRDSNMFLNITNKLIKSVTGKECNIKSIETLERAIATGLSLPDDKENTYAVAAICILYLSHYKLRFPAIKLRAFYTNIREELSLPLFDCKSYNLILANINDNELDVFELIDNNGNIKQVTITKQEIFEALDFYTNQ